MTQLVLSVLAILCISSLAEGQDGGKELKASAFQVDLVSPSREYLFVDKAWNSSADCIQAKISVSADVSSSGTELKAHLLDANGKVIHTIELPSSQADGNGGTVPEITQFTKGKRYQVFFGIPGEFTSGSKKWKRAIVVFGRTSDMAAKMYPKDELEKADFPEKSSVKSLSK